MFTNSPSSLTFCPLQKTTCPVWTIYSWQGFNSIVCPLMLITNYRCLQSLNICVDVAKFVQNVHKLIHYTYFWTVRLVFTEQSIHGKVVNSIVSSYAKKTTDVFTNISLDVAKCVENVNKFTKYTFCPYLSWLNNLFMANFQLTRMSSYAKNKLQMCSVTQHQCRWRQMCGKCSQITKYTHFLSVDLSWLNNLFMAKVSTHLVSSYAKNKLQMCSVTQHQCRRRQMCGKCSNINSLHSLLDCYKKRLVITEQSIHGKVSTH